MNASNRFLSATESLIVPTTLMRDLSPNAVSKSFSFLKAYSDCFVVVVFLGGGVRGDSSAEIPKVHFRINQSKQKRVSRFVSYRDWFYMIF